MSLCKAFKLKVFNPALGRIEARLFLHVQRFGTIVAHSVKQRNLLSKTTQLNLLSKKRNFQKKKRNNKVTLNLKKVTFK